METNVCLLGDVQKHLSVDTETTSSNWDKAWFSVFIIISV